MNDVPRHPRLMKRGNVFYHRASVPEDIRATYGKTEETFSLKTRDPREAMRLVRIEGARVDALFQAHREELARLAAPKLQSLTAEQIGVVANAFHAMILEEDEQERLAGFDDDEEFDLFVQDTGVVERLSGELYARGTVPGFVRLQYPKIISRLNLPWNLEENSETWPVLSRSMVEASIRAIEDRQKRNAGQVVKTPTIATATRTQSTSNVTLSRLFELWERDHLAEGKTRRTARDFRQKLGAFTAYLGHDDALRVTRREVVEFCDMLRHEEGLGANTISTKYLAAIRLLYRTGLRKAVLENDPTERVSVSVPRRVRERSPGFTDAEATAILSASLRDPQTLGKMSELNKLAIRWSPWICAYTGARITEITQLRKQDFEEEKGIPYIRITPEAGSVKTGQYRLLPLHPHLLEVGLLEFVHSRPDGPLFYLPTDEVLESGHTRAASVSGKVSQWVRKVAGITDKLVQPNHGWRHRFKTVARGVGISREYVDAINGHDDGTASVDYGEYPISALFREIQKLPKYEVSAKSGGNPLRAVLE